MRSIRLTILISSFLLFFFNISVSKAENDFISNDFSSESLGAIPSGSLNYLYTAGGDSAGTYINDDCLTNQCVKFSNAVGSPRRAYKHSSVLLEENPSNFTFRWKFNSIPTTGKEYIFKFLEQGVTDRFDLTLTSTSTLYSRSNEVKTGIATGTWYKITIRHSGNNYDIYVDDSHEYTGTKNITSGTDIDQFEITNEASSGGEFIIDDFVFNYNDGDYNWAYEWYDLSTEYPDLHFPLENVCFVDEHCNLQYWYNIQAIGAEMWLIYDNGQPISKQFSATSTVIEHDPGFYDDYLWVSPESEATSTKFCIWLESYYGDMQQCGYKIVWLHKDEYLPGFEFLYDPCADVATSSGSLWDDYRYGMECGFKQVLAWAFRPSTSSLEKIADEFEATTRNFPLNIIYQIHDSVQEAKQSTTTLAIWPLLDQNGAVMGHVIDQATIIQDSRYSTFIEWRDEIGNIIKIFFIIYVIIRLFNMVRKTEEDYTAKR